MTGMVKNTPGPATWLNTPRRMTQARSQSMVMCTVPMVRSATTSAVISANSPTAPWICQNSTSTSAKATRKMQAEKTVAPLRVARGAWLGAVHSSSARASANAWSALRLLRFIPFPRFPSSFGGSSSRP